MADTLFTLPIAAQGNAKSPGSITVTRPAARVYLLTFSFGPDNRLTANFIQAFLFALDILEHSYELGVVITTSSIQKFYSNGMDLDHVGATPGFYDKHFYPLFRRLLTYRMPTVALINGHAFAGGLLLAMHHDYRIQNPDKGFLCMNEVLFGALLQPPMMGIFRDKVDATTFRDVILEGRRYPAQDSLKAGLVDGVGGLDVALEFVKARKLVTLGDTGIFGQLKEDMHRNSIALGASDVENQNWREAIEVEKKGRTAEAGKRVRAWEKGNGKAKL